MNYDYVTPQPAYLSHCISSSKLSLLKPFLLCLAIQFCPYFILSNEQIQQLDESITWKVAEFLFMIAQSCHLGFPSGSGVKDPPTTQEAQKTLGLSVVWEDPWRKTQQPIPIFFPRKSCGQRKLAVLFHRVAKSQEPVKLLSTQPYHLRLSVLTLHE